MDETQRERLWRVMAVVCVVAIIYLVFASQQNNQIVRPVPIAPAAPVVPELPDLIGRLSTQRSMCEGRAQYAIDLFDQRRRVRGRLTDGRKLYEDARAEFNGSIDYVRAALTRRFNSDDPESIARRLATGESKVDKFVSWANNLEPSIRDSVLHETMFEFVERWLKGIETQNEQALQQLRDDLNSCRIREWRELAK